MGKYQVRNKNRYIEGFVHGMVIGCLYLPNGNPAPGPKFDYKLSWFTRLSAPWEKTVVIWTSGDAGRGLQRDPDRTGYL